MPYSLKLESEKVISKIEFNGELHDDAEFIEINLLFNAPEFHEYIGATPLKIHIDIKGNKIELQEYNHADGWSDKKTEEFNHFERGKNFTFLIIMERLKIGVSSLNDLVLYTLSVNDGPNIEYKGDLPIFTINWLWFDGQFDLLAPPLIEYAKEKYVFIKRELEHLFNTDEQLCIVGEKMDAKFEFQISLLNEINEHTWKIGNTPMRLEFNPDAGKIYPSRYFQHFERFERYRGSDYPNTWKGDQQEAVVIITAKNKKYIFEIEVNGEEPLDYLGSRSEIPPAWAVDRITVSGNIKNVKIGQETEKCANSTGQKPLPNNIKQLDKNKLLKINDEITVKGIINSTSGFTIYFLHGALEWNQYMGETVLEAKITQEYAYFDTYYNEKWKYKPNSESSSSKMLKLAKELTKDDQFSMTLMEKEKNKYEIQIIQSDKKTDKYTYDGFIPSWAIQYVVVKGDLEPNNNNGPYVSINYAT